MTGFMSDIMLLCRMEHGTSLWLSLVSISGRKKETPETLEDTWALCLAPAFYRLRFGDLAIRDSLAIRELRIRSKTQLLTGALASVLGKDVGLKASCQKRNSGHATGAKKTAE